MLGAWALRKGRQGVRNCLLTVGGEGAREDDPTSDLIRYLKSLLTSLASAGPLMPTSPLHCPVTLPGAPSRYGALTPWSLLPLRARLNHLLHGQPVLSDLLQEWEVPVSPPVDEAVVREADCSQGCR